MSGCLAVWLAPGRGKEEGRRKKREREDGGREGSIHTCSSHLFVEVWEEGNGQGSPKREMLMTGSAPPRLLTEGRARDGTVVRFIV
ncbi:hypothetical protein E2C01_026411 [Portunus trituberculatus]|uniref:Uncharacterized protein n=1 Tax=Portunus trituberculatus TaxID=210409 RepID=A0A5B7EFK6_PORTR|nr:hypothetical protein [Portunus trituberculatus]